MENIYDKLNSIDDDASLQPHIKLSDLVDDALVVVVDDARTFDLKGYIDSYSTLHDDEQDDYICEKYTKPHIILDKDQVEKIVKALADSYTKIIITNYYKTTDFRNEYGFTKDDIRTIVRQLQIEDYSFHVESETIGHEGEMLCVFVTDREFKVGDKTLSGIKLYAKFNFDEEEGLVVAVSVHPTDKSEYNPYKS